MPLSTRSQRYCDAASLLPLMSENMKQSDINTYYLFLTESVSLLFSRLLRDSTPRYVGPSVGQLVSQSVGGLVPFLGRGPEGVDDLCFHT